MDVKCEVTFKEGEDPLNVNKNVSEMKNTETYESERKIKIEPQDADLTEPNPDMYLANLAFRTKIKQEPEFDRQSYQDFISSDKDNEKKLAWERRARAKDHSFQSIETTGNDVYKCRLCKDSYITKSDLEQHIQEKHTVSGGMVHCQLCEYKFKKFNKLQEHLVACHGELPKMNVVVPEEHLCSLCDYSAATSFNLLNHIQKVHSEKPDSDGQFECGVCPYKAKSLNAIKSHRYLTHFQKNLENVDFDITKLHSCVVCSVQFGNPELLRDHLVAKHNMDVDKSGTSKPQLKRFKCKFCPATFQFLSGLSQHETKSHSAEESQVEAYICQKCGFRPMTVFAMEVHQKQVHSSDLKIKDPLLSVKKFPAQNVIKFSNIKTTSPSPIQPPMKKIKLSHPTKASDTITTSPLIVTCTMCKYTSNTAMMMRSHLKETHRVEQFSQVEKLMSFGCRLCDKKFEKLNMYSEHKMQCPKITKTEEGAVSPKTVGSRKSIKKNKVFRCAICNQRFTDAGIMQDHIGSHTVIGENGNKLFKCDQCGHLYKNPRLLVEHIQNNHDIISTDKLSKQKSEELTKQKFGKDETNRDKNQSKNNDVSKISKDISCETKIGEPVTCDQSKGLGESAVKTNICDENENDKYHLSGTHNDTQSDDDREIKELDDILKAFSKKTSSDTKEQRNKANVLSDEDGSDTSADEDDEEDSSREGVMRRPIKQPGVKVSYTCDYCDPTNPRASYTSRDALHRHQKDIWGVKRDEKFYMRSPLNCPTVDDCDYRVNCEKIMADHLSNIHKVENIKCNFCSFASSMKAILDHHVTNNHRNNETTRTCTICKVVLRDKKNLAGHYFAKHNIFFKKS